MADSPIAFIDLKTQYQQMKGDIKKRLDAVLEHGRYIGGPEITELEATLAEFTGARHAIACSSGTDALLMPLMAWEVGPGDAIFTTPFTFIATAEVISLLGATPVFVDIDPRTFNMDPKCLEKAIEDVKSEGKLRPRGVIPVDLFGLPADYDEINRIADAHQIFVLEDSAQGLGGVYKGRNAGNLALVASTSFYPAKPLGCYGDGGAIFTNDSDMDAMLRSIREHGQGVDRYHNVRLGINGRLDSMQAAVLLVKLEHFSQELDARQTVAEAYGAKLKGVTTPHVPDGYRSAWAQYSVLVDHRDQVRQELSDLGIPTVIYYIVPLHLQPVFVAKYGDQKGRFPVSESVSNRIFSLPMHPNLTSEEVDRIAEAVAKVTA